MNPDPIEDVSSDPIEAVSIELRLCEDCKEPWMILHNDNHEPVCYINLSYESLRDFVAVVQKVLDKEFSGSHVLN